MKVLRTEPETATTIDLLEENGYKVVRGWTEHEGTVIVTKLQKGTEVVLVRKLA